MSEFSHYRDPSVPLTPAAAATADRFSPVHDLWATHKRVQLLEDAAAASLAQAVSLEGVNLTALAHAKLLMTVQPTAADTVEIGGDTYEFLALTTATVASNSNIGVARGASAAAARANLIAAINGAAAAAFGERANGAPAARNGTENVFAFQVGTTVYIVPADGVGGTPTDSGTPSLALDATLVSTEQWNVATLQASLAQVLRPAQVCRFSVTINAGHVSAGSLTVMVPTESTSARVAALVYEGAALKDLKDPLFGADSYSFTPVTGAGCSLLTVTIAGADLAATDVIDFAVYIPA